MRKFYQIEEFKGAASPLVLTIGNFDGIHRGHQEVFHKMKQLAGATGHTVLLTFSNHPSHVLRPHQPISMIYTHEHKMRLLESSGIDNSITLTFSSGIAGQTAEQFLQKVIDYIPFKHLVLGYDAVIGKNRQGDQALVSMIGKKMGFQTHYLEPCRNGSELISSSQIRKCIKEGKLKEAEELLGRPYSIYSNVVTGFGKGRLLGFPTANISVDGLCIPPLGVYTVSLKMKGKTIKGIANLGIAPTVKIEQLPVLEVHLFSDGINLYGNFVEVIFHSFLRPEKKFNSIDELKCQIQQDISVIIN